MTAQRPREISCDVRAFAPDASSLDALARLRLNAKREGLDLRFSGASDELERLAAFCGLAGVLGLEASREAEKRKQRGGVEEERHLDDPAT